MKNINFIILLLLVTPVFGQKTNTLFNMGTNGLMELSREDFINYKIKTISAYSYSTNNKGKIKKKGMLIYKQHFDPTQNKIYGINNSKVYQSHGPMFLQCFDFEIYYNNHGQIIKKISRPQNFEKKVEFGITTLNKVSSETTFEYDELNRLIRETNKSYRNHYSIYKRSKDTFHLVSVENRKIDEYYYNSKNQKTKWYHTDDSTRYLKTKSFNPDNDSGSVRCSYCHPRYLNVEWKYNSNDKLIEWISYTRDNIIHTKRNYLYDEQDRLIKQIDSSGWYFTKTKPFWESIKKIEYSDTGKIVTIVYNTKERLAKSGPKTSYYYNKNNRLVRSCTFPNNQKKCTHYSFEYNQKKLTNQVRIMNDVTSIKTEFLYNENGLLKEQRICRNNKLSNVIRYNFN